MSRDVSERTAASLLMVFVVVMCTDGVTGGLLKTILYQFTKLHGVISQKIVISLPFIIFLLNIITFKYNFVCCFECV